MPAQAPYVRYKSRFETGAWVRSFLFSPTPYRRHMSSIQSPAAKRARVEKDMDLDRTTPLESSDSTATITQKKRTYTKVDLYCPHPFLLILTQQAQARKNTQPHTLHRRHNAQPTNAFDPRLGIAPPRGPAWYRGPPVPVTPPRPTLPRVAPPRPARPVTVYPDTGPNSVAPADTAPPQPASGNVSTPSAAPPNVAPISELPVYQVATLVSRVLSLVEDIRSEQLAPLAPLFVFMFWEVRRCQGSLRMNGRQMAYLSLVARITGDALRRGTSRSLNISSRDALRELIVRLENLRRSRTSVQRIVIPPSTQVQSTRSASTDTSSSSSIATPEDLPPFLTNAGSSRVPAALTTPTAPEMSLPSSAPDTST